MQVLVTGATGNVGTATVARLVAEGHEVVGLARRRPTVTLPDVRWVQADVARDPLEDHLGGVDAVVHLAWAIQPSHAPAAIAAVNVVGSKRVVDAVRAVGVPHLVHASSVAAYAPHPGREPVDERFPTEGIESSTYSRHKAAVESLLDRVQVEEPGLAISRMRFGLILRRGAASGIARLFLGPALQLLARPLPLVPLPVLRFQVVHGDDAARAVAAVVARRATGAFNVAASPVLDQDDVARLLGGVRVPVPAALVRAGVDASWRARLQPTDPGWLDVVRRVPVMAVDRAAEVLGWRPTHDAHTTFAELVGGLRDRAGIDTPPLAPLGGPSVPLGPHPDFDLAAASAGAGASSRGRS